LRVSLTCLLNFKVRQTEVAFSSSRYLFRASVQPSMTFISFPLLSFVMSNNTRGLTSADEEPVRTVSGRGTPAEEKEEDRARKKDHKH
jgi:hypothetical protein